ncbi:cobalamin synthesis protein, P47K [Caballeronia fortuita]|uniref:Cobalamin synthesis protein, P47K n=1 Tax=Caballeronia fortuita TaxID=1777138 RepID=A0A158CSU3_9BURK|nr:GTP-binding protein [Caballeronia fortuita]SAK85384.1 cobalamin synthesis protein, P47K [Caballeronia fortuita]
MNAIRQIEPKLPVTILTGFLGAGKTTLLKNILSERQGERIAIIENEFGETSVDADLLFEDRNEQVIELNNGCICCKVRGDLVRILTDLHRRRAAGELEFGRVIIETTGLADPAPVAQTFFVEDDVSQYYVLDAIVTLVDAVHAGSQLDVHHEAVEQVAFADRLLVSKADMVDPRAVEALSARLRKINARAPIALVSLGRTDLRALLDVGCFSLDSVLEIEPDFLSDVAHEHDDDIGSFVFSSLLPFDPAMITQHLPEMIQKHGTELMRYKGVLSYAGFERKVVLQGVHMVTRSDVGQPWLNEKRVSNIVFIGRKLPESDIRRALEGCLIKTAAPAAA